VQLTKKASYGLIAALELARSPSDVPLSAPAIAERYSLPSAFVEKILHRLRQAGLVTSKQGRTGGYSLAVPPEDLSVRDVLEVLEESLDLVSCLRTDPSCNLAKVCPTKQAWETINRSFLGLLDSLSLADLLNP